jgi:hypothetical protein
MAGPAIMSVLFAVPFGLCILRTHETWHCFTFFPLPQGQA